MILNITHIKAPAGPLILYKLPPHNETIKPPIIAVNKPVVGVAPLAIAKAIDRGIATIETVNPDNKSLLISKYESEFVHEYSHDLFHLSSEKYEDSSYLESDSCIISNVNFLTNERISDCNAKFRYRMVDVPVKLEYLDNGDVLVKYDKVKRVTLGQACVFYKDNQCLGGGIIKEVRKNNKKLWYI